MYDRLRPRYTFSVVASYYRLDFWNRRHIINFGINMALLIKDKIGGIKMKIVVCKAPKFLRGFLRLIFGVKKEYT
jgi:hypothetical protein